MKVIQQPLQTIHSLVYPPTRPPHRNPCVCSPLRLTINRRVSKFICITPWTSNLFAAKSQTRYCGLDGGPRLGDPCVKMKATSFASVFSSRSSLVNCFCTGYNCTCIQNAGLTRFREMVEVCTNGRTDARCWSE